MSAVAILVVTTSYVEALHDSKTREAKEVQAIKDYKTPTILLFFDDLSESDIADAKKLFEGVVIKKEFLKVPKANFDVWLNENLTAILAPDFSG